MFGGNFAPGSWMYCDGSLLSIAEYSTLFSLIGTTYGGDGQQTFALPNFKGRIPVGTGQGPGLSQYYIGQAGGSESVTMLNSQMPMHTHLSTVTFSIPAYSELGSSPDPTNNILANVTGAYTTDQSDTMLAPFSAAVTLNPVGGSIPFSVMQPYLAVNYIICVEGIYPSRN